MIWSVSTSARSSAWTRPSIFVTGSISAPFGLTPPNMASPGSLKIRVHLLEARSRAATRTASRGRAGCRRRRRVARRTRARPPRPGAGARARCSASTSRSTQELVEHPLGEPADLDVLPVQEHAARLEQLERLAVQLPLALVGQVVDAERATRPRRSARPPAARRAMRVTRGRRARYSQRPRLPARRSLGRREHRLGEVDEHAGRARDERPSPARRTPPSPGPEVAGSGRSRAPPRVISRRISVLLRRRTAGSACGGRR